MGRSKGDETTMSLAVSHSESLRTTVPAYVARKLGIGPKDRVVWDLDKVDSGWIATIRKVGDD